METLSDGTNIIYSYDRDGNIIHKVSIFNRKIKENIHYRYDVAGRLISEKCYRGETFDYCYEHTYNKSNDITNKIIYNCNGKIQAKEVYIYSSTIKNQLNKIDIYDKDNNSIGTKTFTFTETDTFRPSSYNQNKLTWEGKRLSSYGNNQYQYNDEGIRISKITSNGITRYTLDEDRIVKETRVNGLPTYYHYDESEMLVGFHYNGEEYFYYRDLVGNIIKIVDSDD